MKKLITLVASIMVVSLNGCAKNQEKSLNGVDMNQHEKINYVEFPAKDIEASKTFFTIVFDWTFVDYGPDYTAFSNAGLEGGFFKSELSSTTDKGGALIVFYSKDIDKTQTKIEKAGGKIVKPIFSFPGGRRFHFADPSDNEFAVWTDVNE